MDRDTISVEKEWRKIGAGSLRWRGQIIKPNQIFRAVEEDLPKAFRKQIKPVTRSSHQRKRSILFKEVAFPDTIYVIGGGVSVEEVDLSNLEGQFVIVVNRAYEIYPKANMLFFGDVSFYEEYKHDIHSSFIPYKVTVANMLKEDNALTILRRNSTKKYKLDARSGFLVSNNSGLMAVNLAYQLGARLIVLIGIDLRKIGGRKHYHDGYRHLSPPKTCKEMLREWRGIREEAWEKNIDILHATPGSALTEVKYVPLKNIVQNTDTMDYYGGWWLPKGEAHFRYMLRIQRARPYKGRSTYQYYNKMLPALSFLGHREGIAVDIGSNVGFWSFPLSYAFKKVHCFEPIPLHNKCWKANHVGIKNVVLHEVALSDSPGELSFISPEGSCGGTHVATSGVSCPVKRLDSFRLRNVSFLKIDCEGYELPILQGAEKTLKRCKPLVVVEQKKEWADRYPFPKLGAVKYLESLGASVLKEIYGDYVMQWKQV